MGIFGNEKKDKPWWSTEKPDKEEMVRCEECGRLVPANQITRVGFRNLCWECVDEEEEQED